MKRFLLFLLLALMLIPAISVPGLADAPSKALDIHGVDVPYHINDKGVLQIVLTEQIEAQVWDKIRDDVKKNLVFIEIDLTSFEDINGFAISPSSWSAIKVELFKNVKLFISSNTAMMIEENASGGAAVLEAAYHFTEEGQISGIDLSTTSEPGNKIEAVGVVSLPTKGYGLDLQNMALSRNGTPIAKSCVLDGVFYAAVSLSGEYTVIEAQPAEFKDEIPLWAKSAVDWMSARGVAKGSEGLFRPNDGITRAEFMTMLARLYQINSREIDPYYQYQDLSDLPEWALWGFPFLLFGVEHDGFLYPNKVMTCGEVVRAILNYIAFWDLHYDCNGIQRVPFTGKETETGLQDLEANRLSSAGILSRDGGKADMDEIATRAQAAELLCRFAKWETFNRTYR